MITHPVKFSILYDWDLIEGAFQQAYSINLRETNMPVSRFLILLSTLPENTKLVSIMDLRGKPKSELSDSQREVLHYYKIPGQKLSKEKIDQTLRNFAQNFRK